MTAHVNLVGHTFSRLTVVAPSIKRISGSKAWDCRCVCGATKIVNTASLRNGSVKSCGCLSSDTTRERNLKHGLARSQTYRCWGGIKQRCGADPHYLNVTICDRWLESFENFFADMGHPPSPKHSIDRIDNSKGYSPENCRWATVKQQAYNRKSNRFYEFNGKTQNIAQWGAELGIDWKTLDSRLRLGWTVERTFTQPVRRW